MRRGCSAVWGSRSVTGKKIWSRQFSHFDVKGAPSVDGGIAVLVDNPKDGTLWLLMYQMPSND